MFRWHFLAGASCPLSFHWALLKRAWPCPLDPGHALRNVSVGEDAVPQGWCCCRVGLAEHWLCRWLVGLAGELLAAPESLPQVIRKPACQGSSAPRGVRRTGTAGLLALGRLPVQLQLVLDSCSLHFFKNMLPCIL